MLIQQSLNLETHILIEAILVKNSDREKKLEGK